jgi:PAS domain S-box-containing protein
MDPVLEIERKKAIDEAILSSVGDGLIATDKNGRIIIINRVAQSMLQLKAYEVVGKDYIDTVRATDILGAPIPREKRPINEVLRSGLSFTNHAVNSLVRTDGTKFPAAITTSPIIFENSIIGAIITFRDSTKEKEIDAMKTDFLSVAAHQLRTPLGTMRWNLEMILGNDFGPVSPSILPVLKQIYAANSRMITLVNDLLDVARIDELRVQDVPQPTNLEQTITSILTEKKADFVKRSLVVNFTPTNDPYYVINIDPKRIREAFENIISNAIKYNVPNGNINIYIERLDDFIKVTFIDSGIGIPEVDIDKITNKFYRARNAIRSETEGSGLGLFVVKSYIEAWGGKIEFSSKEGVGSTFTMYLPKNSKSHTLDKSLIFKQ